MDFQPKIKPIEFLLHLSKHKILPIVSRPETAFFLCSFPEFKSALGDWIGPSLYKLKIKVCQLISH